MQWKQQLFLMQLQCSSKGRPKFFEGRFSVLFPIWFHFHWDPCFSLGSFLLSACSVLESLLEGCKLASQARALNSPPESYNLRRKHSGQNRSLIFIDEPEVRGFGHNLRLTIYLPFGPFQSMSAHLTFLFLLLVQLALDASMTCSLTNSRTFFRGCTSAKTSQPYLVLLRPPCQPPSAKPFH